MTPGRTVTPIPANTTGAENGIPAPRLRDAYICRRDRVPRFPGHTEHFSHNHMYVEFLSYMTYRLTKTVAFCGTGSVRDYTKRMELKLSPYHFSVYDPITVLNFGTSFVCIPNIHEMSEAQAFLFNVTASVPANQKHRRPFTPRKPTVEPLHRLPRQRRLVQSLVLLRIQGESIPTGGDAG